MKRNRIGPMQTQPVQPEVQISDPMQPVVSSSDNYTSYLVPPAVGTSDPAQPDIGTSHSDHSNESTSYPVQPDIDTTLTAQPNVGTSRTKILRLFGVLQIILGVICGTLGIIGAILSKVKMDSRCTPYINYYLDYSGGYYAYSNSYTYYRCGDGNTIFIMDLISLAFSGWFILIGCLPFCMTEKHESSWRCLKIAFLVCNIISAAVFSSTVIGLGIAGALIVGLTTSGVFEVSSLLAMISFIEFIRSIIAASYCCCCSKVSAGNNQGVIHTNTAQSGLMYRIPTGNMQGYIQMWIPIQESNGQRPQSRTLANQQLVTPSAPDEDINRPFSVAENTTGN